MLFERKRLKLKPIKERVNNLDILCIMSLDSHQKSFESEKWEQIGNRILNAKKNNASIVMMIGAHVIRSGVQNYLMINRNVMI